MQQRVLVLGADNFIGRRVVVQLGSTDWARPIAGVAIRKVQTCGE